VVIVFLYCPSPEGEGLWVRWDEPFAYVINLTLLKEAVVVLYVLSLSLKRGILGWVG
jgi:hypothetical protein